MLLIWAGFVAFVLLMLALDLGVFHRKAHVVKTREALGWSAVWIALALAFAVFVYHGYEHHWLGLGTAPDAVDRSAEYPEGKVNDGRSAVIKYLTGYVVEKSLSVDNVFVIAMIFGFLAVPPLYQHRVLFWGILGALVMRGVMIGVGARLIAEFSWILMLFGGVPDRHRGQDAAHQGDDGPELDLGRAAHPSLLPRDRALPRRALLRPRGLVRLARGRDAGGRRPRRPRGRAGAARHLAAHAAGARAHHRGDDRPRLRGRLDPGDLRDHRRPVPGVHEQRVRHPRAALALLRAGRRDRDLPLPQGLARPGAGGWSA